MNLLLLLLGVGVLILLYARFVEPQMLVVRKLRIDGKGLLRGGKPLRIALLSDFHYPRYADAALVQRAIDLANQWEPDLVFILGDFFDKNRTDAAILPANTAGLLQSIRSKRGIFGILGNHDYWFDEPAIRATLAADTDIRLIDNQAVRVDLPEGPLYLVGVGDLLIGNVHYDEAAQDVPPDATIILLSHNPDVVEAIHDPRILIQFSGHTHGGQIRLPFIGALHVPSPLGTKYSLGLSHLGNHLVYVTSGIASALSIRFLCPPEVTWVEIY